MTDEKMFTDGAAYERGMGRWSRMVAEPFLDWLNVPSGLKWLDVGCGNGAFTEVMGAKCAPRSVVGLDRSKEQIAYASAHSTIKTAEFFVGDAQRLSFRNSSFDIAVMALVISFLPDPGASLKEMVRSVKPRGWVAAYMWDLLGGGVPVQPIYAAMKSLKWDEPKLPGAPASQEANMQTLWESAGLREVETRIIRIPIVYSNFDDFWISNCAPMGPAGKAILAMEPDKQEQLRNYLRERLPVNGQGQIAFEAFANAVKGRKNDGDTKANA